MRLIPLGQPKLSHLETKSYLVGGIPQGYTRYTCLIATRYVHVTFWTKRNVTVKFFECDEQNVNETLNFQNKREQNVKFPEYT